jgi:hypothetical protein
MIEECEVCGEDDQSYLTLKGDIYLCSVHICKECGEIGYARGNGAIYCDSCFISEGEGHICESCGAIEHIDQMAGSVCQYCDDRAIFYGGRR